MATIFTFGKYPLQKQGIKAFRIKRAYGGLLGGGNCCIKSPPEEIQTKKDEPPQVMDSVEQSIDETNYDLSIRYFPQQEKKLMDLLHKVCDSAGKGMMEDIQKVFAFPLEGITNFTEVSSLLLRTFESDPPFKCWNVFREHIAKYIRKMLLLDYVVCTLLQNTRDVKDLSYAIKRMATSTGDVSLAIIDKMLEEQKERIHRDLRNYFNHLTNAVLNGKIDFNTGVLQLFFEESVRIQRSITADSLFLILIELLQPSPEEYFKLMSLLVGNSPSYQQLYLLVDTALAMSSTPQMTDKTLKLLSKITIKSDIYWEENRWLVVKIVDALLIIKNSGKSFNNSVKNMLKSITRQDPGILEYVKNENFVQLCYELPFLRERGLRWGKTLKIFPRIPDHIQRTETEELTGKLRSEQMVALFGCNGAGKTWVALAAAQALKKEFDIILYVSAHSALAIKLCLKKLSRRLGLSQFDDINQTVANVQSYIEKSSLASLIIFDNAESSDLVSQFRPKNSKAIVVSRGNQWDCRIKIPPLDNEQQQAFMVKQATEFSMLCGLPLNLQMVSNYLSLYSTRLDDVIYALKSIQVSRGEYPGLGKKELSIVSVWKILLKRLLEDFPKVDDFLHCLIFLDTSKMPLFLIKEVFKCTFIENSDENFELLLHQLTSLGIFIKMPGPFYEVQPSISRILSLEASNESVSFLILSTILTEESKVSGSLGLQIKKLSSEVSSPKLMLLKGKFELEYEGNLKEAAVSLETTLGAELDLPTKGLASYLVAEAYMKLHKFAKAEPHIRFILDTGFSEYKKPCQLMLIHLQSGLGKLKNIDLSLELEDESVLELIKSVCSIGAYEHRMNEVLEKYTSSINEYTSKLGYDKRIIGTMLKICRGYFQSDEVNQSYIYLLRILELAGKTTAECPSSLKKKLIWMIDELKLFLPMCVPLFGQFDMALYDAHTLLSLLQISVKNTEQAINHMEYALNIAMHISGNSSLLVANAYILLARCYLQLKRYQKAYGYTQDAQRIYRKIVGEEHPFFADGIELFGIIALEEANLDESLKNFNSSLQIRNDFYNKSNYYVARSKFYIANALFAQSENEEALNAIEECLSIADALHKQTRDTLQWYSLASSIADALNQPQKALDFLVRRTNIIETYMFEDSELLLKSFNKTHKYANEHSLEEQTETYARKSLEMSKKIIASTSSDFTVHLIESADNYYRMGNLSKAEELYLEALSLRYKKYGNESIEMAEVYIKLAALSQTREDWVEAIEDYEKALPIMRKADSTDIDIALFNCGVCLVNTGKNVRAESLLREALKTRKKKLGKTHLDIAPVYYYLSMCSSKSTARKYLEKAKKIFDLVLGANNSESQKIQNEISKLK